MATLLERAQEIRDEIGFMANTHTRVGQLFMDIVEFMGLLIEATNKWSEMMYGIASIPAILPATNKATVDHNLGYVPDLHQIVLTPQSSVQSYSKYGVENITETSFDIVIDVNAEDDDVIFGWRIFPVVGLITTTTPEPIGVSLIKYGKLYTYEAATNGTLLTGMALASDSDWDTLLAYIDSVRNPLYGIGACLKHPRKVSPPVLSTQFITNTHPRWGSHSTEYGLDIRSFSAFPGGGRHMQGSFFNIGYDGYWWTANELSSTEAWNRSMYSHHAMVGRFNNLKGHSFSLRCVRAATQYEINNFSDGAVVEQILDFDGNLYDCLRIGTQIWTRQNIATTKYANGDSIVGVWDYNNDPYNSFFQHPGQAIIVYG